MQVSTAMGMFEQSLELNPEATDAKTNLELSFLRHEELMKKKHAEAAQNVRNSASIHQRTAGFE